MADVTLPANLVQEFQDAEDSLSTALDTDKSVDAKKKALADAQSDLNDTLSKANSQHKDANTKAQKLLDDLRTHFNLNATPPEPTPPAPTPVPPSPTPVTP